MMPMRLVRRLLNMPRRSATDGEPDPDDPVCLAHAPGEAVAGMWKATLESQGIPAILHGVTAAGIPARLYAGLPTDVEVRVRRRDAQRAAALLGIEPEMEAQ